MLGKEQANKQGNSRSSESESSGKGTKTTILKRILAPVITALICILLLIITALIPQSAIREKSYESATYYMEHDLFAHVGRAQFNSMQDNYADCILSNIIYNIDSENPVQSVLLASYYSEEKQNVNVSFMKSMEENLPGNTDYLRYWHGSMVVLRPLLTVFNITQIRVILGIIVYALILSCCIILWKKQERYAAAALLLASLVIKTWMTGAAIEYVTTFLVMGVASLIVLLNADAIIAGIGKNHKITSKTVIGDMSLEKDAAMSSSKSSFDTGAFFLCIGIVTCFVDFLTTETITFTISMALILLFLYRSGEIGDVQTGMKEIIGHGIFWLIGYAGMFGLKWLLAALVFGGEALSSSLTHAAERVSGEVNLGQTNLDPVATTGQRLSGAIWHNLGCLFPFSEVMNPATVIIWTIIAILIMLALMYLFHTEKPDWKLYLPMLLLALLPYVRYLALSNHAYLHYFFTYRAQLITVFVLFYLLLSNTIPGIRSLLPQKKRKGRK